MHTTSKSFMSDVDDDEREVVVDGEEGECRMNRNDEQ